jgi:hypothetical protein
LETHSAVKEFAVNYFAVCYFVVRHWVTNYGHHFQATLCINEDKKHLDSQQKESFLKSIRKSRCNQILFQVSTTVYCVQRLQPKNN